jgi:hypothetical protein
MAESQRHGSQIVPSQTTAQAAKLYPFLKDVYGGPTKRLSVISMRAASPDESVQLVAHSSGELQDGRAEPNSRFRCHRVYVVLHPLTCRFVQLNQLNTAQHTSNVSHL